MSDPKTPDSLWLRLLWLVIIAVALVPCKVGALTSGADRQIRGTIKTLANATQNRNFFKPSRI
jgi:hypothetical protein